MGTHEERKVERKMGSNEERKTHTLSQRNRAMMKAPKVLLRAVRAFVQVVAPSLLLRQCRTG